MTADEQLIEAAQQGDLQMAVQALDSGADVDAVYRGVTALWWASQEGHTDIVKLLVGRGADISISSDDGFAPLHQAVGEGHVDLARFLIENGAKVDSRVRAIDNGTPLQTACAYGLKDCAEMLLAHGADPGLKDDKGKNAADFATMYGHDDLAELVDNWSARPPS